MPKIYFDKKSTKEAKKVWEANKLGSPITTHVPLYDPERPDFTYLAKITFHKENITISVEGRRPNEIARESLITKLLNSFVILHRKTHPMYQQKDTGVADTVGAEPTDE